MFDASQIRLLESRILDADAELHTLKQIELKELQIELRDKELQIEKLEQEKKELQKYAAAKALNPLHFSIIIIHILSVGNSSQIEASE